MSAHVRTPWYSKSLAGLSYLNKSHPHLRGCVYYFDHVDMGPHEFNDGSDASNGPFLVSKMGGPNVMQPKEPLNTDKIHFGGTDSASNGVGPEPFWFKGGEWGYTDHKRTEAATSGLPQPPLDALRFTNTSAVLWAQHDTVAATHWWGVGVKGVADGQAWAGQSTNSNQYQMQVRESTWTGALTNFIQHNKGLDEHWPFVVAFANGPSGTTGYFHSVPDGGNTADRRQDIHIEYEAYTQSISSDLWYSPASEVFKFNYATGGDTWGVWMQLRIYNRSIPEREMLDIMTNPWAPRSGGFGRRGGHRN